MEIIKNIGIKVIGYVPFKYSDLHFPAAIRFNLKVKSHEDDSTFPIQNSLHLMFQTYTDHLKKRAHEQFSTLESLRQLGEAYFWLVRPFS